MYLLWTGIFEVFRLKSEFSRNEKVIIIINDVGNVGFQKAEPNFITKQNFKDSNGLKWKTSSYRSEVLNVIRYLL